MLFILGRQPKYYLVFICYGAIIAIELIGQMMISQNITAERAVEILKKGGLILTEKEAKQVLNFLYKMAKLEVKEALKK